MISNIIFSLSPIIALFAMVTMLVLRAGASRVFFDVVGSFQADRLIGDAQAKITVLQGLMLDGLSGITEGIGEMSAMMDTLVDGTVPLAQEIGNARIEFEKFANFEGAEALQQQIIDIGESYAFTGDQALAAGAKMAQLSAIVGGGPATAAATEVGIQFGLIGGMETEDAMKKMISLQQQTGFMYGDLTKKQFNRMTAEEKSNVVRQNSIRMLNQLNTIENRSAATMSQITHVMNQFASSAKLAGDDVAYMAAMSATLIEAGEEQGKAGRALKMMYARLGADTGNNAEILRQFGIETKGANGELRSMEAILQDVADRYHQLEDAEKLAIAQAIAGNDHYVRAIKLFENHSRVLKLDSDAVAEKDTAQEELNKRMKDNVFLLEQQQARLINSKALIGNAFTPAVIRATKAQADMNFTFAQMIEEGTVYGQVIGKLAQLQQLGKTYAPIAEAYLNALSLNVSLKTQQQIQRSLNNESLVRSSAYGAQVGLGKITLQQLDRELGLQAQSTALQIASLGVSNQQSEAQSRIAMLKGTALEGDFRALQAARAVTQQKVTELQIEQQSASIKSIAEAKTTTATQQRIALEDQVSTAKIEQLSRVTAEELALKRINAGQYKKLTTVEAVLGNARARAGIEKELENNENIHAMKKFSNIKQILRLQEQQEMNAQTLNALTAAHTFEKEKQLSVEQKLLQVQDQMIADEGRLLLLGMMNSADIQGDTMAHMTLAAAKQRVNDVTKMKSNTETQNAAIMKAMSIAATQLAATYGLQEKEIMKILPKMKMFAQGLAAVQTQQELTVASSMRFQSALMKSSMGLGMLSMGFTMFSDSEKAARTSMILMNLSMLPAIIQMASMTKGAAGMAAGMVGIKVTTDAATGALTRFKLAVISTGVGAAVLAAVALGAWFLAGKMGSDEANESLEKYNRTFGFTQELYDNMLSSYEGVDMRRVLDDLGFATREIQDTLSDIANSEDAALIASYETKLKLAQEERDVLLQIKAIKGAEMLLTDTDEAKGVYDMVKNYQDLSDAATVAADANNLLDMPANFLKEKGTLEDMTFGLFGTGKSAQQNEDEAAQLFEDAFAAIPEQFQGAVQEMAEESDSMEDFLSKLAEFADSTGGDFGRNFGTGIQENIIGPIEAAKEAAFEFSNAREEMFFGLSKGNLTGDMVKQVVNKGVETLINTTEVIMTNNFTGMTTTQAANEITKEVMRQLQTRGLNVQA